MDTVDPDPEHCYPASLGTYPVKKTKLSLLTLRLGSTRLANMCKTHGREVAIISVLADGGTKAISTPAKERGRFLRVSVE